MDNRRDSRPQHIGVATAEVSQLLIRLEAALRRSSGESYDFSCSLQDVVILGGLICLAADHPAVQEKTDGNMPAMLERFHDFCVAVYVAEGLSREDAERLYALRMEMREPDA